MKFLDKLQRRFGRYAVPRVTEVVIASQVLVYILCQPNPGVLEGFVLIPAKVLEGEVVRLFSFVLLPPVRNLLCAFFFWYLFYLMGTALEATWGTFRYNVFLLIGYAATVAASFLTPDQPASGAFLQGSVFLAFAYLYPEFELRLFFILPVRIKWLALLTWISYFLAFAFGPWQVKASALASVSNFLVFFGGSVWQRVKSGRRRMAEQSRQIKQTRAPWHVCRICGLDSLADPQMDFRYCSKCADASCYCQEHLRNHEHVSVDVDQDATDSG